MHLKVFSGNQIRLVWYSMLLAEISAQAPTAMVMVSDSRDVTFQSNPFTSMLSLESQCYSKSIVVVHDCKCSAANDRCSCMRQEPPIHHH